MKKDFRKWHFRKKLVHESKNIPYFYEREIWWCSIGLNVGYEQDGKNDNFERPVLVLKKIQQVCLMDDSVD
jgi:mRNA interferase MazF